MGTGGIVEDVLRLVALEIKVVAIQKPIAFLVGTVHLVRDSAFDAELIPFGRLVSKQAFDDGWRDSSFAVLIWADNRPYLALELQVNVAVQAVRAEQVFLITR